MLATSDFHILTKQEYFRELCIRAEDAKAGSRFFVEVMNFMPEDSALVREVAETLARAAARGVVVTLSMDAHDFMLLHHTRPGPLWLHAEFPERMDHASRMRLSLGRQIEAAGGVFAITNQPHRAHTNPFYGRSHIKAAVIGDDVYIGGCNLNDDTQIDLMVRWHDPATAGWLYNLLQHEAETQSSRTVFGDIDQQRSIDEQTTLFIDAGVRNQSIIFEQALQLIDEAQERIFLTCQYFPHSITATHLKAAARRGVAITLLYNRASKHGVHAPMQQAVIWQEYLRGRHFPGMLPANSHYLHAKLLVTEKATCIGSHNYVAEGVRFGTAEIALLRRNDPTFGLALAHAIIRQTPWHDNQRFSRYIST